MSSWREQANSDTVWVWFVSRVLQYFRARYVSEGSRGPMRGRGDGPFPTVKVSLVDLYVLNLPLSFKRGWDVGMGGCREVDLSLDEHHGLHTHWDK